MASSKTSKKARRPGDQKAADASKTAVQGPKAAMAARPRRRSPARAINPVSSSGPDVLQERPHRTKRVVWPTKPDLVKYTGAVLGMLVFFGILIAFVDAVIVPACTPSRD